MKDFSPDSPLVHRVTPALALTRGRLRKEARGGVAAIVMHTTGRGVYRRAKQWDCTPLEAAEKIYSSVLEASGHYVVGQDGVVAQLVPEAIPAWHVGYAGSAGPVKGVEGLKWWRDAWPDVEHPYDLNCGKIWQKNPAGSNPSANSWTIGIEVVPPERTGAPWSSNAWAAVIALTADIGRRHSLELRRETLLRHSDLAPRKRTRRGQPWDPPPAEWTWERHLQLVQRLAGNQAVGTHAG